MLRRYNTTGSPQSLGLPPILTPLDSQKQSPTTGKQSQNNLCLLGISLPLFDCTFFLQLDKHSSKNQLEEHIMFASIKTQRFPSSLLLLVLLTLNNASAHRNKPFLRKAQSTPTNEMQCLQDTVDFVSASRDLTAHSLLYYSNLMDGLSTEQQPEAQAETEAEADTEPIDDTTPVILVDISSSEFRQTCTEEGGIVLVEPELNVSCQNQGGVIRSFKIVNAANCLSSQDSCNGIDLVTSYRPLLEDENMVCQRIISQGVVQQGGAEEEDEVDEEEEMVGTETDPNAQAEVQDNDIDTDTDMDNDMDNQEEDNENENENEEGNVSVEEEVDVDDEVDEEEDGELSDDSIDSDEDEDDEDMSVSASASSSALKTGVGRVGGPVVGVLLLVLVGIGAAWFMMKRRRNDK